MLSRKSGVLRGSRGSRLSSEATQRVLLSPSGRRFVEENLTKVEGPSSALEASLDGGRSWYNYYDTKLMVLARQDVWLRERDDKWELRIPEASTTSLLISPRSAENAAGRADSRPAGSPQFRLVVEKQEILHCLGLDSSEKAWSTPPDGDEEASFQRFLSEHGQIRPFARLRVERRLYIAELPAEDATSGARQLVVDLEHIFYDTTYVEPAALSALLEAFGEKVRDEALQTVFAEFKVAVSPVRSAIAKVVLSPSEPAQDFKMQVSAFLKARSLDHNGGSSHAGASPSSAFLEYLRQCRPAQLRAMTEAGVHLDTSAQDLNSNGDVQTAARPPRAK